MSWTKSPEKRAFLIHALVWAVVCAGLAAWNMMEMPAQGAQRSYWFQWPLLGWGIGVAAHGLALLFKERESTSPLLKTEAQRGFWVHLFAFVAVNILLVAVDLSTTPGLQWAYWPIAAWGVGIAAHGFAVWQNTRKRPARPAPATGAARAMTQPAARRKVKKSRAKAKPASSRRARGSDRKATSARKSAARRSAARKPASRKSSARKSTTRMPAARGSSARRRAARKSTARTPSTRRSPARKTAARRSSTRKTTTRKMSPRKPGSRKAATRSAAARRSTARRRSAARSSTRRPSRRVSRRARR
ncbi:MAG: 2TM domain-containing protein [Pseudomonadota bacterium]|nr:2TM domain-containing protein [Pseudomonadota bacterium]